MSVTKVEATLVDDTEQLTKNENAYSGELTAPKTSGQYGVGISAYDDAGNVSIVDGSTNSKLLIDVSLWHPPKTNWKQTDRFNIEDYNRIKNNLVYLHEKAVSLCKPFETENMGDDITSYESYWDVEVFNMFERNLEKINQNIFTQDYGCSQTFFENGPFIRFSELNRIEGAILQMNEILERQKTGLKKLSFRLGRFKEVRI